MLTTSKIFCCLNGSVWITNHIHSFSFIFYLHHLLKIFQAPLDRKKPEIIPARESILLLILHAAANWYVVTRIFSGTILLFMRKFFKCIIVCLVIQISRFIFVVILTFGYCTFRPFLGDCLPIQISKLIKVYVLRKVEQPRPDIFRGLSV